jgi:hypothetical protein
MKERKATTTKSSDIGEWLAGMNSSVNLIATHVTLID